jgi:hypothetical protein
MPDVVTAVVPVCGLQNGVLPELLTKHLQGIFSGTCSPRLFHFLLNSFSKTDVVSSSNKKILLIETWDPGTYRYHLESTNSEGGYFQKVLPNDCLSS